MAPTLLQRRTDSEWLSTTAASLAKDTPGNMAAMSTRLFIPQLPLTKQYVDQKAKDAAQIVHVKRNQFGWERGDPLERLLAIGNAVLETTVPKGGRTLTVFDNGALGAVCKAAVEKLQSLHLRAQDGETSLFENLNEVVVQRQWNKMLELAKKEFGVNAQSGSHANGVGVTTGDARGAALLQKIVDGYKKAAAQQQNAEIEARQQDAYKKARRENAMKRIADRPAMVKKAKRQKRPTPQDTPTSPSAGTRLASDEVRSLASSAAANCDGSCRNVLCRRCWWPANFIYRPDLMLRPSSQQWSTWPLMPSMSDSDSCSD